MGGAELQVHTRIDFPEIAKDITQSAVKARQGYHRKTDFVLLNEVAPVEKNERCHQADAQFDQNKDGIVKVIAAGECVEFWKKGDRGTEDQDGYHQNRRKSSF
ncbi:MAG: hypothetical protein R3D26_07250 [Cyanobacteriota/Melainabacteria group bacterium]